MLQPFPHRSMIDLVVVAVTAAVATIVVRTVSRAPALVFGAGAPSSRPADRSAADLT